MIVGIDPDTKAITLARIEKDGWGCDRIEVKGRRAEDRLPLLADAFRAFAPTIGSAQWVYLEEPMMVLNARALIAQAQVIGIIRSHLWELSVSHSLVNPSVWKKGLLGNGHASKDEIKAWAIQKFQADPDWKQDYFDALCIAQWGKNNFGGER